ncbi:two component Fis family sigma54 specific transcriptional regulator [Rhodovulum imhoffii]|uniref:Nif-specific regulatory protein n=2 Tax=Rhodovulum imhoffii TaxID=365340 RepID=A0A2T5BL50_9RHOB|nr:hypothetical protein [Rhodovulum imhoffii]PTM99709.1 two component Fis family sigma54 specific transcriptional regulator [Rhodovulum imhoffii]
MAQPASSSEAAGTASDDGFQEGERSAIILCNEPRMHGSLSKALSEEFSTLHFATGSDELHALVAKHAFETLVIHIGQAGGVSLAELVQNVRASVIFDFNTVVVSDESDLTKVLACLQDIDAVLLRAPFGRAEIYSALKSARERRRIARENFLLQRQVDQSSPIKDRVVGESEAIQKLWDIVRRVAPMPASVLITGETGTGKELTARALHDLSGRTGSFVPVNCAAIPADIIESELFGHVRGAFSGAVQSRQGLFGHADGGTLFLDEIGELPLAMQAKLLRVLENKRYRPLGHNQETTTSARLLFATNRNLPSEIAAGRFREDLYYRMNVLVLNVPPLRERRSDISRLALLYMNLHAIEIGQPPPPLEAEDLDAMLNYDWPGNIRELRNVIERSLLLNLPIAQVLGPPAALKQPAPQKPEDVTLSVDNLSIKSAEEHCIAEALRISGGNKSAAARLLGVSRKTVERRIKRMNAMNKNSRMKNL